MSFVHQSQFVNLLLTDERLNGNEFSLKRKRDNDDDNDDDDGDDNEYDYFSNHNKKNIKNDVLLSEYNTKLYNNPLLNIDSVKYENIEKKINYLYKLYNLQIDNNRKLNTNLKTLYRYSITQFNDLNTKIDILNTKLNRFDTDIIDITHKLCLKIEKLEKEIKKSN